MLGDKDVDGTDATGSNFEVERVLRRRFGPQSPLITIHDRID